MFKVYFKDKGTITSARAFKTREEAEEFAKGKKGFCMITKSDSVKSEPVKPVKPTKRTRK